jgi:hypothetical protein
LDPPPRTGQFRPPHGWLISGADRARWLVSSPGCVTQAMDAGLVVSCQGRTSVAIANAAVVPQFVPSWFEGASLTSTDEQAVLVSEDSRAWGWRPETGWYRLEAGPGPRFRAGIAFDRQRQRVVVFGGALDGGLLDDTWEFDGSRWSQRLPTRRPPARTTGTLAFDERRARTVLFGGFADGNELGDTWEWDGTEWTQFAIDAGPSPRDAVSLAWDGVRQEVLLFGGWDGLATRDDTWSWDGTRWVQLSPATKPSARSSGAMVWNPALQQVVLASANDSSAQQSAALWNGTTWATLPDVAPQKRAGLISFGDGGVFWVPNDGPLMSASASQLINGAWVDRSLTVTGIGAGAEDGGAVLLSNGFRWDWRGQSWVPQRPVPFVSAFSATATPTGLLVLADDQTWESRAGTWTNRGASGFLGPLVTTFPQGVTKGFQGSNAFEWTGSAWASRPWPMDVSVSSAVSVANDDALFVATSTQTLRVDATGVQEVRGGKAPGRLFSTGRDWPASVASPFIAELSPEAQRWNSLVVTTGLELAYAGRDEQGHALLVDFAAQRALSTFIYDPTRSTGSVCSLSWQCSSGACVDGRCCNSACTSDSVCRACSVERGATEDGVCTDLPGASCTAPQTGDAGVDAGVSGPDSPRGCGCSSSIDVAAALWLLLLWGRRSVRA